MAKKRTSASSRLDDSWVVSDHNNDSDADWEADEPQHAIPSRRNISRRTPQPSTSVPGPDLVMPSYENISDRSRTSAIPKSSRPRNRAGLSASAAKGPQTSQISHAPKVKKDHDHGSSSPSGQQLTINALIDMGDWLREVIAHAAHYLKRPIGMILAAYLFCGLVVFLTNLLTNSIYTALSPICRVPGVSYLDLPICRPRNLSPTIDPSAPPEFDELIKTQDGFNSLIAESADTISIPSSLKSGELSVRDLRSVVQYASVSIPSKEELLFEINGFIDLSRRAVQSLTQFNSHVGRSCDMVLSNGRWTQRALDDLATQDATDPRPNPIVRFLLQNLLHPFQPVQFTTSRLLDLYIQHTTMIESEIHTLLLEAQSLLTLLQSLEDRLDTIAAIAARGNTQIHASRDEVLGHLWTWLGGNRAKLAKYNNQLSLLRDVSNGRKQAWRHVAATVLKLQEMAAEVEGLKERLGGAGSLIDHPEIPLGVHVESVRMGVERLDAGRQKAREVEREFVERRIEAGREREGRGERWVIDP